jgi:hypothetical protein
VYNIPKLCYNISINKEDNPMEKISEFRVAELLIKHGENVSVYAEKSNDLKSYDLRKIKLNDYITYNIDFSGSDLSGLKAQNKTFERCCFKNSKLINCEFKCCNFKMVNFEGANLKNIKFDACDLGYSRGNGKQIKNIQIDGIKIIYTQTSLQIGCSGLIPINDWKENPDVHLKLIEDSDSWGMTEFDAVSWFNENKYWIFKRIEQYPAEN